jgi:hypothetical protein
MKIPRRLLILPALGLAQPAAAELRAEGPAGQAALTLARESSAWTALASAHWASRYLSEGRQNWGNAGILTLGTAAGAGPFGVELWQGLADSSADREFQATGAYSHLLAGGTSLGFRSTLVSDTRGHSDWEFGLAATGLLFAGIEGSAQLYHSTGPNGAYLEIDLSRPLIGLAGWDLGIGADTGSNFGYVRNGHRGPDHFGLRLEGEYGISPRGALTTSLARYSPLGRNVRSHPGDASLYDGWFFRIGAQWKY